MAVSLFSCWVEDVAQTVADQVEREHGEHDGETGKDRDPGRGLEVRAALVEHVAPRRRRRLRRQSEIGQRGLDENRLRQRDGALHDERRDHVGQDVLERDGHTAGAEGPHGLHVVLGALGQHGPRITRAKIGVYTMAMASTALLTPGPRMAAMPTASSSPGC